MAVVSCVELPRERSASGTANDGNEYTRGWLVRTDSLDTSMVDIYGEPGVSYGDLHPDDASAECQGFDCKAADEVGLLWLVSARYAKKKPDAGDSENPEGGGGSGSIPGHVPVWGGSSSVSSGPVYRDRHGNIMANSAGDPFDAQEADIAEARLTKTEYYTSHTGWLADQKEFTNTVNSVIWNGGGVGTWKCQGCSAKLNIENENGITSIYWEVTWEFAYRADGWELRPWDVGFNELVDANGDPEPRDTGYDASTGTLPSGGGTERRTITGQDGKPVKQPVALTLGVAKPAGSLPDALFFEVYEPKNFDAQFGEVTTPGFAP